MKKIISLFLISCSVLILMGCGKDFEKKQECTKYIPEMEDEMRKAEKEIPSIDTGYPQFRIKEIFYSPKADTCIVDVENKYSQWNYERVLFDVLTREEKIIYVDQTDIIKYIKENDTMDMDVTLEDYQKKVDKFK